MSSTNKTANLGLNSWIESDRPKRTDFVSDNTIIDNVLGNHVKDNGVHLTAEEKQTFHECCEGIRKNMEHLKDIP